MEKEERKARRKEKKRKEKEREEKALKRLSAASARLLATPSLRGINEEDQSAHLSVNSANLRGRHASRTNASTTLSPDLPKVAEQRTPTPEPPPPVSKDPARSTSSTRRRPLPPPKEYAKRPRTASRHSSTMMRNVQTTAEMAAMSTAAQKRKRLYQMAFRDQLASIKAWFRDSARRASPTSSKKGNSISSETIRDSPAQIRRSSTAQLLELRKEEQLKRPELPTRVTLPARPRLSTTSSYGSNGSGVGTGAGMSISQAKRLSLSPQPLTPRSSYRRRSGLGRRKSTSSSVSSVRSFHLSHPSGVSHSKASSTSSASASIASPNPSNPPGSRSGPSPHASVKILPASPATVTLPPSIRIQRRGAPGALGALPSFGDMQQNGLSTVGPSSPGMHAVFARQKRKVFKGPTNLVATAGRTHTRNLTPTASAGGSVGPSREQSRKRQSIEIVGASALAIAEEEEEEPGEPRYMLSLPQTPVDATGFETGIEEEDAEDEVEEVDGFSPISCEAVHTGLGSDEAEDGYFRSAHAAEIHMVVSNGDAEKGV